MKPSTATLSATIVLAAAAIQPPPAQAVEAGNATGMCQGALPVFDTEIRKRPLALRNEGDATAYVSCSFPFNAAGPNTEIAFYMVNRTAAAVDVDCTFVDGLVAEVAGPDYPVYYPQSISAAPGVATVMLWLAADFGLPNFSGAANLSCALPPGVELAQMIAAE